MGFFDTKQGIEQYVAMADGYDGRELIEAIKRFAQPSAMILELGMGPGKDLALLESAGFKPTGSDSVQGFIDYYNERDGSVPTLLLDARSIDTDQQFDGIYSNKVLQHLTRDEFVSSLRRQREVVKPGGILFHSLWLGEGEEEHSGLLFTKYTEDSVRLTLPDSVELIGSARYKEMEPDDSFWVALMTN